MSTHLDFRAAGVTFQPGYPDNLHQLRSLVNDRKPTDEPMPVVLIRDPGNVHDANCIEIHTPSMGRLGSVPAHLARDLAPRLDGGERWLGHIEGVFIDDNHPDRPGVSITLRRLT